MRTMRLCLLLLGLGLGACNTSPPPMGALPPVGQTGGALVGTLDVIVVTDSAYREYVDDATVTCGDGTVMTGSYVHCDATGLDRTSVVVSAPGRVTERWIGITEREVVIALAPLQSAPRTLQGQIEGTTGDVTVGVSTELDVTRGSSVIAESVGTCTGAECEVALTASPVTAHDVAVLDHEAERFVVVRDVPIDALSGFAIDVRSETSSAALVELDVTTLPTGEGLVEVVGVPGLSSENGVALLGALDATSTLVPAREGALADARLWFVAHATTEDGTGESFALDRDIPSDGTIALPSTFLPVPTATRTGDTVTVTPVAGASLYVIESGDGETAGQRVVVFGPTETFEAPVIGGSVRVRAIETATPLNLDLTETATRFSDRAL